MSRPVQSVLIVVPSLRAGSRCIAIKLTFYGARTIDLHFACNWVNLPEATGQKVIVINTAVSLNVMNFDGRFLEDLYIVDRSLKVDARLAEVLWMVVDKLLGRLPEGRRKVAGWSSEGCPKVAGL